MERNLDYRALKEFYAKQLKENILPFWMKNGIDTEEGGFFTCFSNDGSQLATTDKYIWSQGRMVWVLSRLSQMDIFSKGEKKAFLGLAGDGLAFTLDHCFLDPSRTCAFLLDRRGVPKEQEKGLGLAPSTFADCFVALGLIAYMDASQDFSHMVVLEELFHSLASRYEANAFQAAPFYVPKGAAYHAVPMSLLYVCNEYGEFLERHFKGREKEAQALAERLSAHILDTFVLPCGAMVEITNKQSRNFQRFLFSYTNPGHALEDCWFLLGSRAHKGNREEREKIFQMVKRAFALGWDQEFGGIRYYAHIKGGRPHGTCACQAEERLKCQMLQDWNNKLWWPNTEALYASLLSYVLSGDKAFKDMFFMLQDYIFRTFPNPNKEIGEWIQLRGQDGTPIPEAVGGRLPVKDPYHIARNFILLIGLANQCISREEATSSAP